MSDCECGAHYMQNCSWWCGLSSGEYERQYRLRFPEKYTASKVDDLEKQILELKEMVKSLGGKSE